MTDKTVEEGLENFPKPNATAVEPLATVELEPEQKVTAPTDKTKAKRPADNDNPEAKPAIKDSVEIDDTEEAKPVMEQSVPEFTLSEDIGALLESIEFPEEFKQKAITIFEASVTGQVADLHKAMLEANAVAMESYKESLATKLEEQSTAYMTEAVAKWLEENQVQVKSNLRTQIAESFMAQLVDLLESHYIQVPENKEDVLEATLSKVEELESALAEQVELTAKLKEEAIVAKKLVAYESAVAKLTDVQKERVATLAESIDESDIAVYTTKLTQIIESLVSVETIKPAEFVLETGEVEVVAESEKEPATKFSHINALAEAMSKI